MSWPASFGVGVLTALLACVLAGVVAGLAVDWYHISSFEGGAGYFVVAMALLGAAAGAVIGIVASRWVGASGAGFLRALGAAWLVTLLLLGATAGTARLLADVPPRLEGRALVLAVELQWPDGALLETPTDSLAPYLRLAALRGRTVRASVDGPLWLEDARTEEGRRVVPGAVDVFTSRGRRLLLIEPFDAADEGFLVPLPARPARDRLAWSEWLPREGDGGAARFRYRYRVVPDDEPIRTTTVGPFEIGTMARGFYRHRTERGREAWAADTRFIVRYRAEPVTIDGADDDPITALQVIAGATPALLASVAGGTFLMRPDGDAPGVERMGDDPSPVIRPLTTDAAAFAAARDRLPTVADVDRTTFAQPGAYLIGTAVLDTRTLAVRHLTNADGGDVIERIPPLGIAPDGTSIVRLAWAGDGERTRLAVLGLSGRADESVEIERTRMRYADIDQVDPVWLQHYFAWRRGPDGQDHLEPRADAVPLPYRGVLTRDASGYREYRLSPAREGLRPAFEAFLVEEFGAAPTSADPAAFAHELRIGDAIVHVSWRAEDGHVGVWMDRGTDTDLVETLAARFDEALATGRYDAMFGW